MKRITSTLAILLVALAALAQSITPQQAVDRYVNDASMRNASVGVMFMSVDSGKVIASANPDLGVITASTMKTVVSLAALEELGGDFRFETPVYITGKMQADTLVGNIIIVGAGDPTLGTNYIDTIAKLPVEIVDALKARGIKAVAGRVITDSSLFPTPYYSEYWEVGDLAQDYGAGVFPLNYRDNTIRVNFAIDRRGKVSNAHFVPAVPGVGVVDRTSPSRRNRLWSTIDYGANNLVITGNGASGKGKGHHSWIVANPCPDSLLLLDVRAALDSAGIALKGQDINAGDKDRKMIVNHQSPVLTDIVTSLLDRSDNMFAHALLRALGVRSKDFKDEKASLDDSGVAVVKRVLENLGIDTEPLYMYDGSGLARNNKSSVTMFCNMLRTVVDRRYNGKRLVDLMPNAGKRIGKLLPETELKDNVHLKSGSMSHVQCFVGYYPADNPQIVWAMLANNYSISRPALKNNIDRLLIGALLGK